MYTKAYPMYTNEKVYYPYVGPFDPCPPIRKKRYSTPPNLYLGFQPPNLPQFPPAVALRRGTLWPALYSPYDGKKKHREGDGE